MFGPNHMTERLTPNFGVCGTDQVTEERIRGRHGQTNQSQGSSMPRGEALDAVGDSWSLLIVRDAFDGLRRFGDFQKNLGPRQEHPVSAAAQSDRARHSGYRAGIRRQRLSGICPDREGTSPVSAPRCIAAAGVGFLLRASYAFGRPEARPLAWKIGSRRKRPMPVARVARAYD